MPNYGKFAKDDRFKKPKKPKKEWPRDRPDFLKFILYKENTDTGTLLPQETSLVQYVYPQREIDLTRVDLDRLDIAVWRIKEKRCDIAVLHSLQKDSTGFDGVKSWAEE